ncbi:signal peptidase I [Sphingomonas qomolangmaensis]|uniref:Signal peptidase I n=1 Tax=Sphingomonas qomolangmaensis TaxID=2918765 RepID=A0ABY5L990_9SPHN|nr:signal peptidase I [Sphingomonas qomolangmaensis]UUL82427.1 signal peptidase I [Sphingomonas qomolangmaensis]
MAKSPRPAAKPTRPEWQETLIFLVKLALFVFVIRSFLFAPFVIPSGSMLPRTLIGDYLFVTKWNYGYSRHSLPWSVPLIPGRILASTPARGDVAVFKAPPQNQEDWIKRVIGLPGDRVQMRDGQLFLNGTAIPKARVADFVLPVTPNSTCEDYFRDALADGTPVCRYPQYRETLPNGVGYNVLDLGFSPADDTEVYTVPAGHVFMMGDNRDDSRDSRFADSISFVPMENLVGKAVVTFWSTDGNAGWLMPWTWPGATRWERIGEAF